ncbi:hypothetical protein SUGI_0046020 [Cryptomeria japonica]|nr:hypothetical protein SUGI_0046020 [Cryptomeria japonica]
MATFSLHNIAGAGHSGRSCRICYTSSSQLIEWRFAGKYDFTEVVFQSNRRCPQKFSFKLKASTRPPYLSSSGFRAVGNTETEEAYPNAPTTEIAQEDEEEKQKQTCSSVEGSDSVLPENWGDAMSTDDVKILFEGRSKHNYIRVLEVSRRADHFLAGARLLLLDKPGNIHSMYYRYKILTQSYYDVFGTLPPLLPHGTLGILGMGAGTAAHILLHFWPSIDIHGWELDPMVISVGRKYFDLLQLESDNRDRLGVHIGDALEADVPGGFSGLIVDLFSQGSVIPHLQSPRTWQCLKERLKDGGRIMVNCGGKCVEAENPSRDGHSVLHETLGALAEVFPGEVFVLRLGYYKEDSSIALTGSLPDVGFWRQALPSCLRSYVGNWVPVSEFM